MANIQDLIVVGITLLMGAALGYWFGRSSGQTEARLIRERIGGVERDRADLASDSKRLNEEVARLTGELGTATASLDAEKTSMSR